MRYAGIARRAAKVVAGAEHKNLEGNQLDEEGWIARTEADIVNGEMYFSRRLPPGAREDFRQAKKPAFRGRIRVLEGGIWIE